jgi:hypothetical protein
LYSSRSNHAKLAHANDNDLPVPVGDSNAKIRVYCEEADDANSVPSPASQPDFDSDTADTDGDDDDDPAQGPVAGIPFVIASINARCCGYGCLYGNKSLYVGGCGGGVIVIAADD